MTFKDALPLACSIHLLWLAAREPDKRSEATATLKQLVRERRGSKNANDNVIHAGVSHAAEVPLPNRGVPLEWMAARLKAANGIVP